MRATWYVLEDGSAVDPAECGTRDDGRIVHESGALVGVRGSAPSSRGVDLDDDGRMLPASADMTPEPPATAAKRAGYKTRGGK